MDPTSPLPLLHDSAATACCAGAVPASPRTRNEETGRLPRLWALSGSRRWLQFLLGLAALAVVPTVLEFVPSEYLLAEARRNLWFVAREMWGVLPYLILGVGVSAWAQTANVSERIRGVFARRERYAIAAAAMVGAAVPLCACSVVPLITALFATGIPLGPVMAFWISSPLMSPSMFLLTAGTLGILYAVALLVAAITMGAAAGYAVSFLTARGLLRHPLRTSIQPSASSCATSVPQGCCGPATLKGGKPFWAATQRPALFLGKWLLVAYFLEALIVHYVPPAWIVALLGEGKSFAIPLATAVGIPLYVSGVAALPMVQGLLSSGMAPGAALAFLIAGPVTTVPAMVAVWGLVRWPTFVIYLLAGVIGSLAAGYIFQALAG